jgi:hypothetical protein
MISNISLVASGWLIRSSTGLGGALRLIDRFWQSADAASYHISRDRGHAMYVAGIYPRLEFVVTILLRRTRFISLVSTIPPSVMLGEAGQGISSVHEV